MKTKKTLQHIAAVAVVLLTLCLVFVAPVSADDLTATVSDNGEFKDNVTQNAETIVINLNADVSYDIAAWSDNALGGTSTKTITINGNYHTLTFNHKNSDWNNVHTNGATLILNNVTISNSNYNNRGWNGHDINFNCSVELTNVISEQALAFKSGANLKNVTISDLHPEDDIHVYSIWIQPNGQTVSLDGCEIITDKDVEGGIVINDLYVEDEQLLVTLNVKDTKFTIPNSKEDFPESWQVHGAAIIVESSEPNSKISAEINLENVDITDVVDDSVNAVWVINKASSENVQVTGGTIKVVNRKAVAKIDNDFFDTLAEAVEAAEAVETVTLLKDVTLAEPLVINNEITLDLNGKTLSYPDSTVITQNDGTLTVKNGTISGKNAIVVNKGTLVVDSGAKLDATNIGVKIYGSSNPSDTKYSTVTINDGASINAGYAVTIHDVDAIGATSDACGITLTIKGGTFTAGAGIFVLGNIQYDGNVPVININGGTFTSIADNNDLALAGNGNAKWTISGGLFSGKESALGIKAGTYDIRGGKFTAEGDYVETPEAEDSASEGTGSAISITGNSGYARNVSLEISGGSFVSTNGHALFEGVNTADMGSGLETKGKLTISGGSFETKNATLASILITNTDKASVIGGTFNTNPSTYVASGYAAVPYNGQYLVQKMVEVTYGGSTTDEPEEPEQPEEPVVEPETPAAPGEVASSTEVTDGGDVTFETPAGEDGTAPAAADDEVKGVVLPTGTEGTVEFVPVSEQPAPAGQEENTKRVFEINVPSYKKGEASVIKFQMTVAEIEADGKTAADVALWHYDEETGEWTKLVTSFIIKDGIVYFEAITNDFSPFAIVYANEPAADLSTDTPETPEQPEEPASPAPVLAVLVALGAAVVLRRK